MDEALSVSADSDLDFEALDQALRKMESLYPRKVRLVELRFFGGLSMEEAAEILHVSTDTLKRDWRFAKLWLLRELGDVKEP